MENLMKKLYVTIDEKNVRNKKLIDGIYDVVNVDKKKNSAFADMPDKTKKANFFYEKYIESITDLDSIGQISDGFSTLVTCNIDQYKDTKAVKKTLTIPSWLNDRATSMGVNFSQTLQEALINQLHLR